ncbi:hypothetical protein K504DRAFT_471862 [Pleomassaria siparia CBS 279.74]|uniref:Uncharacterized protein n=1 Tax=Pleomassaria siparia CBS 279.74 TaxID=1314801 RepID=A0A6G1JWA9_9PLEO|nr:hypothetical protein K504DRAFT_471862 [Pleomassaria siparia CBS 279.74]
MASKRKRSSDDSPLSASSSSFFARTPDSLSPAPFPYSNAMDIDASSSSSSSSSSSTCTGGIPSNKTAGFDFGKRSWGLQVTRVDDVGGRTRKRFRDNRPDESVVHQKTMHILFSAQQRAHAHSSIPVPVQSVPATPPPDAPPSKPQKSTLHSFWNLPAPPVTLPPPTISQPSLGPHCEDCDAPLNCSEDAYSMDVDMDVEMNGGSSGSGRGTGGGGGEFACNDCGRSICGTCAVVSKTRHCLQCATTGRNSRRWW